MFNRKAASLIAAAALIVTAAPLAQAQMVVPTQGPLPDRVERYSDAPKYEPGDDPANWSARQNVAESERYEQLLRTNPTFLKTRIDRECGSINEPDLYQQCIATFR
jgi:hypothetical protein